VVLPFKLRSGFDRRRLNPSEYPSLEAAGKKSALVAQLALTKAPTSALLGPPSGLVSGQSHLCCNRFRFQQHGFGSVHAAANCGL
jgi:hypothetical protein